MRRLERVFACFLIGGVAGAIIGAIGGTLDRGSLMILMPSGSPFWAFVGAILGSVCGSLYGALSRLPPPNAHFIAPEKIHENNKTRAQH